MARKSSYLNDVLKEIGNDYASIVDDGVPTGDVTGYIDTGSYIINAQISGSIDGGIPDNKVTVLAGHEATGKTFFCIEVIKNFLEKNDEGYCFYFESEGAISKDMFSDRGIDTKRIGIIPVSTVQEFRTQCLKLIRSYKNVDESERKPILLVLDSLGNLSTTKEMEDSEAGKETRDMTRAQLIKGTFRVITLALSKVRVPLLVTNHTYQVVGSMFASKEMGGGCLVKNTMVETDDECKPIQDIVVGDKVLTIFGCRDVVDTFMFDDKEIYEIEFTDGNIIRGTGEHKFLMENSNGDYVWKSIKDIDEGDDLLEVD